MPRPIIEGSPIRRIDMRHTSAGKNKDYRVTISEITSGQYRVYVEYGPAGRLNQGQEKTNAPVTLNAAISIADKLVDSKLNQSDSYQVLSDQNLTPAAHSSPPSFTPATRSRVTIDSLSPASRATLTTIF